MNVASNPSAWSRCVVFRSKSAVSDITSRRRVDGRSAEACRSRFGDAVLAVLFMFCSGAGALELLALGSIALPGLATFRVRRERMLTILMTLGLLRGFISTTCLVI